MPHSGLIYNVLAGGYEGLLRTGLRTPRLVIVPALLADAPAWWLYEHVDRGFMPEMDEGAFVLDYQTPPGTSLQQTDAAPCRVEALLLDTPEVAGYVRRTGANRLSATSRTPAMLPKA